MPIQEVFTVLHVLSRLPLYFVTVVFQNKLTNKLRVRPHGKLLLHIKKQTKSLQSSWTCTTKSVEFIQKMFHQSGISLNMVTNLCTWIAVGISDNLFIPFKVGIFGVVHVWINSMWWFWKETAASLYHVEFTQWWELAGIYCQGPVFAILCDLGHEHTLFQPLRTVTFQNKDYAFNRRERLWWSRKHLKWGKWSTGKKACSLQQITRTLPSAWQPKSMVAHICFVFQITNMNMNKTVLY